MFFSALWFIEALNLPEAGEELAIATGQIAAFAPPRVIKKER